MIRLMVATCLMLIVSFVQASTEQAMSLYKQGDYEKAYSLFESYAHIGNADAQFNIGVMFYKGQLFDRDTTRAYGWMALAGETSGEERHVSIANKVFAAMSEEKQKQAVVYLEQLRQEYGVDAINAFIKPVLLEDKACEYDIELVEYKPAKFPKPLERKGLIGVVELEYTIMTNGMVRDVRVISTTHKDFTEAALKSVKSYRYAVPEGEIKKPIYNHRNVMTFLFADSKGDNKKIAEYLNEFKEKAELGDVNYQIYYAQEIKKAARFARRLEGFDFQDKDSNYWYYKAADNGSLKAQHIIGRNQYYGQGCEVNKEAGLRWLLMSASQGYPDSQYLLAVEFLKDKSLVYHEDESLMWLEEASKENYAPAKVKLAWIYATAKEERFFQPEKVLTLLEDDLDNYFDDISVYEAKAAGFAANGQFKKAVKYQKKALSKADDYNHDISVLEQRLAAYKDKTVWRQSIHEF